MHVRICANMNVMHTRTHTHTHTHTHTQLLHDTNWGTQDAWSSAPQLMSYN